MARPFTGPTTSSADAGARPCASERRIAAARRAMAVRRGPRGDIGRISAEIGRYQAISGDISWRVILVCRICPGMLLKDAAWPVEALCDPNP